MAHLIEGNSEKKHECPCRGQQSPEGRVRYAKATEFTLLRNDLAHTRDCVNTRIPADLRSLNDSINSFQNKIADQVHEVKADVRDLRAHGEMTNSKIASLASLLTSEIKSLGNDVKYSVAAAAGRATLVAFASVAAVSLIGGFFILREMGKLQKTRQ